MLLEPLSVATLTYKKWLKATNIHPVKHSEIFLMLSHTMATRREERCDEVEVRIEYGSDLNQLPLQQLCFQFVLLQAHASNID